MVRSSILLSLALLPILSCAQSEIGAWYMSFNTVKFKKNWQFQNDIQYRTFNFLNDMEQLMLRGGFGYNLTEENNNILQGYALIRNGQLGVASSEETHFNEHRLFQQYITNQHFGRFYFSHRYRIEERILPDNFKIRFRYFLNIKFIISEKQMEDRTLYASIYNELFINGQDVIFDRNRLYGAIGYAFSTKSRLEAGVMSQIYKNSHRPQFQLAFFKTLDLRK